MTTLTNHLNGLMLSERIRPWTDRCLEPGALWEPQLRQRLESADIIILLISAEYWSSDFAAKEELSVAIGRGKTGQATIVPIILKPCSWRKSPIADFNVLPMSGVPLSISPNMDEALAEITDKICELATAINERKSGGSNFFEVNGKAGLAQDLLSLNIAHKKPSIKLLKAFPHPHRVLDAAFNRTASKLATACDDGRVRVFNVRDFCREALIQTVPKSLQSVSWSRTGREIATGDSDGSVRIWRDAAQVLAICWSARVRCGMPSMI